jgi:hypothetical protein
MNRAYIERCIHDLAGMIASFQQAAMNGGRTVAEGEVLELLKDARLKLVEELEEEDEGFEHRMSQQSAPFEEDENYYSSQGLHAGE